MVLQPNQIFTWNCPLKEGKDQKSCSLIQQTADKLLSCDRIYSSSLLSMKKWGRHIEAVSWAKPTSSCHT